MFVVHALDVHTVDVPAYSTPANFMMRAQNHVIARAAITTVAGAVGPHNLKLGGTGPF